MSRFEDNLWQAVIDAHGETLAEAPAPAPVRRPRPTRALGAGVAAAAALFAAALTLVLVVGSGSPAYAVTRQHDGSVLVQINRPEGIAPANAKLVALGVHAELVAVPAGRRAGLCRATLAKVVAPTVQARPIPGSGSTDAGTTKVVIAPSTPALVAPLPKGAKQPGLVRIHPQPARHVRLLRVRPKAELSTPLTTKVTTAPALVAPIKPTRPLVQTLVPARGALHVAVCATVAPRR